MSETLKVVIVDDHPLFRHGLTSLLATQPDLRLRGCLGSGDELLELLRGEPIDVVLLDLRLPGKDGLSVLEDLRRLPEPPRIVILSSHEGDSMVTRALEAGATAYVSKNAPGAEVLAGVRAAAAGQRYVSSDIARMLASRPEGALLTERENEILEFLVKGLSNKEIGDLLGITEKTVKNHLNHVYAKLEVTDRTQAVLAALERGLIGPQPL